MLYLWKIMQTDVSNCDFYEAAIVCAETGEAAQRIHPGGTGWDAMRKTWANSPATVVAERIGVADDSIEAGSVILTVYIAG